MTTRAAGAAAEGVGLVRRTLVAVVAGVIAALSPIGDRPAMAACTATPDAVSAMRFADSVFVGRVVMLEDLNRRATFEVIEIWKGRDLGAQVVVSGSLEGAAQVATNDRTYLPGQTYLVVPLGSRSPFLDDTCSATRLYSPSGGTIPAPFQDAVGATVARIPAAAAAAPEAAESSGSSPLVLGGGAVIAVLLIGVFAVARRRRRKRISGKPRPVDVTRAPRREPVAAAKKSRREEPTPPPKRRHRRRPRVTPARFSRSGLSNLETMRKKTRRIKDKKQKSRS